MAKKRLILVSHSPLLTGGAELTLLEIIIHLHAQGHVVKVVLPAKGAFSKRLSHLKIPYTIANYRWGLTEFGDTSTTHKDIEVFNADSIIKAYQMIKQFSADVVISNTIVVPWFGYAARAAGVPHARIISETYGADNNFKLLPTDEIFLRQLRESTDYAIYNSKFTQSLYAEVLPDTPSTVLYPAITISEQSLPLLKSHAKLGGGRLNMIVFGSIVRHKNQMEALEALQGLVAQKRDVHLTILGTIGSNSYNKSLLTFIRNARLQKYVTFMDHTPEPFTIITEHQVVLVPSLKETFGRVTVEAQLLGRIVIGANTAGTAELINNGKTGLQYEAGDVQSLVAKIGWVIDHPKEAEKLAEQAQKSATAMFINDNPNNALDAELERIAGLKIDQGDVHFNYIHALIERNIYVNGKIKEYADALVNCMDQVKRLETSLATRVAAKVRRRITKSR